MLDKRGEDRMQLEEWLEVRELLNHDILCNQVRSELAALQSAQHDHRIVRLKHWPEREPEYRRWLDATFEALSPAHLLDSSVFSCWSEDMRSKFRPAVHQLFLATTSLGAQVRKLHELLGLSVKGVREFVAAAPPERTADKLSALEALLAALSAAISALPRSVSSVEVGRYGV